MPSDCLFMHSQPLLQLHLELKWADVMAAWYSLCLLVPAYWNDLNSVNCNTKCYTLKTHSTLQKNKQKENNNKNNKSTYSPINYMKESLCVCVRASVEVCFDCCLVLCFVMGCAPIWWEKKKAHKKSTLLLLKQKNEVAEIYTPSTIFPQTDGYLQSYKGTAEHQDNENPYPGLGNKQQRISAPHSSTEK